MKTRTLLGGIIVTAVIIGAIIGRNIGLPGLGGNGLGLGTGPGTSSSSSPLARDVSTSSRVTTKTPPIDLPGVRADMNHVVFVRIEGHDYQLGEMVNGQPQFKPITLAEIVRLAKAQPADTNGFKIRIDREQNARASAEVALKEKLLAAGVQEGQIDWQGGPPP